VGHNGRGLGKQLVNILVEYAREEKKYIIPLCPYRKGVLEKNPEEYRDVLANIRMPLPISQ
jgi:uncharacterized protein